MSNGASSLATWAKAIKATLDDAGVDSEALFERAGLDLSQLHNANARYSLESSTKLWRLAVDATDNPALGLAVCRHINQTTFHALGYSLLASPTLAEAFERIARYFRIVTDAAEVEFIQSQMQGRFVVHPLAGPDQPAPEAVDAMLGVINRMCRILQGRQFVASEVLFRRAAPTDTRPYQQCFRAPLTFDADVTAFCIDHQALVAPLATGNSELARHNDAILARLLMQLNTTQITSRVKSVIAQQLSRGEPTQEGIAQALNMSPRSLQRKLRNESTTYSDLLDQTRRQLANSYLESGQYTVTEITFMLGFADTSSFSRAFRRWNDISPTAFLASTRST